LGEISELRFDGPKLYFTNLWNIGETFTLAMVFISILGTTVGGALANIVNAIAVLSLWLYLMAHIRGYQAMGSLIQKLTRIFADMRSFLLVQFIFIFGFALAFKLLLPGKDEWKNMYAFVTVFRMMLGDSDAESFHAEKSNPSHGNVELTSTFGDLLYILYCMVILIVMFNMLIGAFSSKLVFYT
jgi:hypothetical protein